MSESNRAKLEFDEASEGLTITLASGDDGNYLGVEELEVLTDRLCDAEDSGKRWVLLRQHGRDFCLGRCPGPAGEETRKALIGFVQRLQSLELITVAAADGGCAGFGVGLFALADISIAAEGTWFHFPEILDGPAPAIVATWLYDRAPYKQALRWTLTGATFGAADAYQFGIASQVVAAGELPTAADATISLLDSLSVSAMRNCKSVAQAMSAAPRDPAVRRAMALKWFQ